MPKLKMPKTQLQVQTDHGLTWINVPVPSQDNLDELKRHYPFLLDLDLRECLPPFQRPKLVERDHYLFMVLLFPIYDRTTRRIRPTEIDIFIGRDFVITNHAGDLPMMRLLADGVDPETGVGLSDAHGNPGHWTYTMLRAMIVACFPMLAHVALDVNMSEQAIFERFEERTVRDILRVKSNIVDFRKVMQGHKSVYRKFVEHAPKLFSMRDQGAYFEDLVGMAEEIWDYLENDQDTIDAIYASHMSLVSFQTNEAISKLTALAFVIFPTALAASIFSMDSVHMPIRGTAYDFWIMLAIVASVFFGTMLYLKRKRWL